MNKNLQNFNFENELCKVKIPIPFTELIKNPCYKNSILNMMGLETGQIPSDTVNLQEEHPIIFIGSALANKTKQDSSSSPPFYITLTVHDQMIHNCFLDFVASHNLMPKAIIEALGLSITKPYQDLYAFDSRVVLRCWGAYPILGNSAVS